ncbi:MAG TPA: hypothetical protein VLA99_04525 [Nitrospiraceae bacterium]|nr:hypothetical protein [Nitrospiraceae bacterium]
MAQTSNGWFSFPVLSLVIVLVVASWFSPPVLPAPYNHNKHAESDAGRGASDHAQAPTKSPQWEGSAEGKAYSEFSHQICALCVLLIGFGELRSSLGGRGRDWAMYLLPGALIAAGMWLLIWSDHDAWPVGHMSFLDTFVQATGEIAQHKQYGLLALGVGAIELARRREVLQAPGWLFPLPLFAIVGGLMLFSHDHGPHPAAQHIAMHHALMGSAAVAAGIAKTLAGLKAVRQLGPRAGVGLEGVGPRNISWWDLTWSLLVLVIAVQLLLYRE